jgi:hypothetical protein
VRAAEIWGCHPGTRINIALLPQAPLLVLFLISSIKSENALPKAFVGREKQARRAPQAADRNNAPRSG